MAYIPDLREVVYRQFKGSAQAVDPYDIDLSHGLYSQNVDFIVASDGTTVQVGSRLGSSQLAQVPASETPGWSNMANWMYGSSGGMVGLVIYYVPTIGVKTYSVNGNSFSVVRVPVTNAALAMFAFNGVYAYIAFNTNGISSPVSGYVLNDITGAADTLFTAPINSSTVTYTTNVTAGAGVVTAGAHRVGFLVTSRSGQTVLCPMSSVSSGVNIFAPTVVTAPDGTHSWTITINFSGGVPVAFQGQPVQIVMSTVSDPATYIAVPNAKGTMPNAASGSSTSITVNIDDGDLEALSGGPANVTFLQNQFTQDFTSAPPFKPYSVFVYSDRMGYCAYDPSGFPVVFFSDQNAFQSLTLAYHGIYLEGRQIPVHGVSLGAICYIASINTLFNTQDNGGYPSTWTPAAQIDGSVGILSPTNMIVSGGKVVMASEKGLFFYRGGAFPQIPISYWQTPDWQRINWSAPTQVQVMDDDLNRVVRVLAPLKVVVTNASNTNPIEITTAVNIADRQIPVAYPHLFQPGLVVTISGVGGNTAANTTAAISAVTAVNKFTIAVAGNGAYTGGGTVTPNEPNAELSWNYSQGEAPGELLYSLNAFQFYRQGTAAMVKNLANNLDEAWYGPATANPAGLIRRVQPNDVNPHRDVNMSGAAAGIISLYETGLAPGDDPEATLHDFHGVHLRTVGHGGLAVAGYGVDHVRSVVPAASPIALSSLPGQEVLVKWWMRNEQQSLSISQSAADDWWVIVMAKVYWTPSMPFR